MTADIFESHNQLITYALDGYCSLHSIYGHRKFKYRRSGWLAGL